MPKCIPNNLFVLEMANNHMGDLQHGLEIIRQFSAVCLDYPEFNFGFKLQYRDLDSFIHPSFKNRTDLPYIKRFSKTRLGKDEYNQLVQEIRSHGLSVISTPFDESSVDLIELQEIDFIKIASCSFNDWPLLERIVQTNHPIIASTGGASTTQIDNVVSFFEHRKKDFVLMHCVAEYPTPIENLQLNQIDFFRDRYPQVRIGFSTHEEPNDATTIQLAIAKGARVFEKHVGLGTVENPLNAYSANTHQITQWLSAARRAFTICGEIGTRHLNNTSESLSLRSLRRGVFLRKAIKADETIHNKDVYFSFPAVTNQITTDEWSKYSSFTTNVSIGEDEPVLKTNTTAIDLRKAVWDAVTKLKMILSASKVIIPNGATLELSHHYGIEKFEEIGLGLITVVNQTYCKKILISLPNQLHPEQFHRTKSETFHILYGKVDVTLNGETSHHQPGSVIQIDSGVRHSFKSSTGCVIEELSSSHSPSDSFYTDDSINSNKNRKTFLTYWMN